MRQDTFDWTTNNNICIFQLFFSFPIYVVTGIMHQCPFYHYFSYQIDAILILFLLFMSFSNAFFCFSSIFFFQALFSGAKRNRIAFRAKTVIIAKRTFLSRKRKDDGATNTIILVIKMPKREKEKQLFYLI